MSVWTFVWAINRVSIDPLSQILDMFYKQKIFFLTPKIIIICQILFTGPHQNFFKSFLSHYFSMADSMRAPISINLFLLKSLVFMMILLALVLPSDYLIFSVCPLVSDKNQVKFDLLSQNLYVFQVNNLSSYI